MPRKPRILEPNRVYHVFNRRTDCQLLFPSPRAYEDFVGLMAKGRRTYDIQVCTYCVMETHWHQAIWVRDGQDATRVARYLRWLSASHALRFRRRSGTRGHGHVYQDRYKSVAVENVARYLTLLRYIEANPLTAGYVDRAERWPWSGLADRLSGQHRIICEGPFPLPGNWTEIVNARVASDEIATLS